MNSHVCSVLKILAVVFRFEDLVFGNEQKFMDNLMERNTRSSTCN